MHGDWLIPDWPAPARVHAVCTTRAGGLSQPPFDSLNLGDHVGDDAPSVARNRERFAGAIGVRPVFLQQVHGTQVVTLDAGMADGTQADGCVETRGAAACTIMVADCLPILLADSGGRAVAAGHAGWRGLAGSEGLGIVENLAGAMWSAMDAAPAEAAATTMAWLGPCIGAQAFEVGDEVRQAFIAQDAEAAALFQPRGAGKWLADLQGLARRRLAALGITRVYGNDGSASWCTFENPSRFFSYRRDGTSGRFAASVWLG